VDRASTEDVCKMLDTLLEDITEVKRRNRAMVKELAKSGVKFEEVLFKVQVASPPEILNQLISKFGDQPDVSQRIQRLAHPALAPQTRDIAVDKLVEVHQDMAAWIEEATDTLSRMPASDLQRATNSSKDAARVLSAISEYLFFRVEQKYGYSEDDVTASVFTHSGALRRMEEFNGLQQKMHDEMSRVTALVC